MHEGAFSNTKAGGSSRLELAVVTGDRMIIEPLPLSGSVTIGRDEGCQIRIDDTSISRRHAILHLDPPLRIEDLGSQNGTFVRAPRPSAETMSTHPLHRLE